MALIQIIKNDIFAQRFGGSLYTRFNQGQLEGLFFFIIFILNPISYQRFSGMDM